MGTSRTTIQSLLNALPTTFPDNNTGLITPQVMRDYFNQVIQSLFIPDARILNATPPIAVPLTPTFTAMPLALWGTAAFDASGDVSSSASTGRCTCSPTVSGLSYISGAQITGEGPVNTQFDFSIGVNGAVPTIVLGSLTTDGAGRDVNVELSTIFNSLNANDYLQLYGRAPSGNATFTFTYCRFNLVGFHTWD